MPLIAHNASNERIDITLCENPKESLPKDLHCPYCGEQMLVIDGGVMAKHFRHKVACTSDWTFHPESTGHLAGKTWVAQWLRKQYPNAEVLLEYPIEDRKRIADIAMRLENGRIEVHEIQLSKITRQEINQRTNDYLAAGIAPSWWFGTAFNQMDVETMAIEMQLPVYWIELSKQTKVVRLTDVD